MFVRGGGPGVGQAAAASASVMARTAASAASAGSKRSPTSVTGIASIGWMRLGRAAGSPMAVRGPGEQVGLVEPAGAGGDDVGHRDLAGVPVGAADGHCGADARGGAAARPR